MALALLTVTVAQLFDLGTLVRMVATHGAAVEANPIARFVLTEFGLPTLAVAKVAGLSLVVAIVVLLAGRETGRPQGRIAAVVTTIAIVAGMIGGWSNTAVIL